MSINRLFAGTLVAAALVAMPLASVRAFSPDRQTYTCNSAGQCIGADHVQFNSFTNNPAYGDERNFLMARDAAASTSTYSDTQNVSAGKEYVRRFFIHNNAQQSLAGANNYVAQNTKVRVALPGEVNGATSIDGFISASNANPGTVSDNVVLNGSNLKLEYVAGSASIRTNGLNDVKLSDSIVSSGAPVGYDALNGNWPGCFEFSGWVTLKVRVVAKETPPAPVFKCNALSATAVTRTKYTFVANATATNGATITNYAFDFGDGNKANSTTNTVTHEYAKEGKYVVSTTLTVKVGDQTFVANGKDCTTGITVAAAPPVTPPTTPTPTQPLPNTGPGAVVGLVAGSSAVATALHYGMAMRRSRRDEV